MKSLWPWFGLCPVRGTKHQWVESTRPVEDHYCGSVGECGCWWSECIDCHKERFNHYFIPEVR